MYGFRPLGAHRVFVFASIVVVLAAAILLRTRYCAQCAVPCVVSVILAVSFGVISGVQWFTDTGDIGFVSAAVARIEGKIDSLSAAERQHHAEEMEAERQEAARAVQRHAEEMEETEKLQESQKKLERLVIDASPGGAASVQAIAGIRDLLRPGNPEIDSISAEQLPALVKRIIEDLKKPAANPEDFSGTVKRVLTEAQSETAQLNFSDAARVLDDALAGAEAADRERANGRAALLAERGRVASLQLKYKDAADYYGKAAEAVAFDPIAAISYRYNSASALYADGDEFGKNVELDRAIAAYRSLLSATDRIHTPLDWARVQDSLGDALATLGERKSGTARLDEAVIAYRAALGERTRERVPLDWAMTENNLGLALETLGEREGGTARLEEAVAAYRAALGERTRERVPLDWAATHLDLRSGCSARGRAEQRGSTRQSRPIARR